MGEIGRKPIVECIDVSDKDREFIANHDLQGWILYLKEKGFKSTSEQALELLAAGIIDPVRVAELTVE